MNNVLAGVYYLEVTIRKAPGNTGYITGICRVENEIQPVSHSIVSLDTRRSLTSFSRGQSILLTLNLVVQTLKINLGAWFSEPRERSMNDDH